MAADRKTDSHHEHEFDFHMMRNSSMILFIGLYKIMKTNLGRRKFFFKKSAAVRGKILQLKKGKSRNEGHIKNIK